MMNTFINNKCIHGMFAVLHYKCDIDNETTWSYLSHGGQTDPHMSLWLLVCLVRAVCVTRTVRGGTVGASSSIRVHMLVRPLNHRYSIFPCFEALFIKFDLSISMVHTYLLEISSLCFMPPFHVSLQVSIGTCSFIVQEFNLCLQL